MKLYEAKKEIETKVGTVVADMLGKMNGVEEALRKMEAKGEALHEQMERGRRKR